MPHSGSGPAGITSGPDGNLWFTEHSGNRIGRLSTTGTLTEIELPKGTGPAEIVAGSDGNLWFAEDKVESHRARHRLGLGQGVPNPDSSTAALR